MRISEAPIRRLSATSLALALVWFLVLPQFATASIAVSNFMEGSIDAASEGPRFYSYTDRQSALTDTEADFDLGTYVDTEIDATGELLQLAGAAAPSGWWDTDWGARRCFTVANPSSAALTEYQVRFVFDSTADVSNGLVQSGGQDYRAVASDNTTLLDFWLESGPGTTDTTAWVQLDVAAVSSTTFCLYFDNATATSVSSQADVFTYSTPQQLYFPLYWRLDGGGGTNGRVNIVSFVDNNSVTVGATTLTLNQGQVGIFTGVDESTTITVTGPIAGRGLGGGMDSIVPISFAGTDMVFPTNRSNQRWTMISPTGVNATVEIRNGTAAGWSGNVGGTAVVIDEEITGGRSGIIESTNGVPILVTHTASNNSFSDSLLVPPFFAGDDIYGVRSRNSQYGFALTGSVTLFRSDSTSQVVNGAAGTEQTIGDGADLDGNGTAIRMTNMSGPTGGLQQADRDGFESTSYLPERLLESEYYLPTDADYIAFSCPTSTTINVGGLTVACTKPGANFPGHGIFGSAPQGTRIFSTTGDPFFAYYEDSDNDDETNLFGMKSAQAYSSTPPTVVESTATTDVLPTAPLTGTWTSPVIDTTTTGTNVFGILETIADLPTGTGVTVQLAKGATPALALIAPFHGPDGTTATSYTPGKTPLPFNWDFGDAYVIARITLTTTTAGTTPTVESVELEYDLAEVSMTSTHTIDTTDQGDTDWVLRVWTQDPALTSSAATAFYLSSSPLFATSKASIDIATESQVVQSAGTVIQTTGNPVTIGPGLPHNVHVSSVGMAGSSMTSVWQTTLTGTSILIPHTFTLNFT